MSTSACVVLLILFYVQCEASVIDKLDFQISQFYDHHTDEFYAKENVSSRIIVRRGANFNFTTILKQPKSDFRIYVQLSFAARYDTMKITLPSFLRYSWNLTQSKSARGINFVLHIPGYAPVGIWRMHVFVTNNNGAIIEQYQVPHKIIVLFNAWSKEDPAYFKQKHKLTEYVLAESGYMYFYDYKTYIIKPWIYGQFQPQILASILFILNKSTLSARERGDIVKVTRTLTHLLNYEKGYLGVLVGQWTPPYETKLFGQQTTNPMEWTGSVPILRKYYETKGIPVAYGQCWVYAGILTTVLRGLGIASRPVANFASAHDEGHDLTMDRYFEKSGLVNDSASDTVWNFHEWVHAWFRRDDLGLKFGEWQNLDATPQAINDGNYQVGPASSSLIKNSQLRNNYETEYVYSEVNADQVFWSPDNRIRLIKRNSTGLAVVTKALNSEEIENITHLFKPKENTQEERDSYRAAAESLGITPPSLKGEIRGRSQRDKMLSVSIGPLADVYVGSAINIDVLLLSKYSQNKEVTVTVKASSIYYHGKFNALIKKETRKITIPASGQGKAVFTIQSKDYIKLLTSMRTIVIEAVVLLEKQIYNVMQHISLKTSELEILVPKAVDYNSKFNLTVKFKNPLNQTLRNLRITVEGNGIKRKVVKLSDLTAYETENVTIQLKSKYYGLETIVITLYSDILKEIDGHVQLQVKGRKRHVFAMYTKINRRHVPVKLFSNNLEAKDVEADSENEQNQNLVTEDEFTCCTLVYF